jgi:diaminopimelate epimerase
MRFEKWQALGNDYLIVEPGELPFELTRARIARLCESHLGVGADGVLLLAHAASRAHVADLRIFNHDGSEAELSGNGAREAALYLRRRGWTDQDEFAIGTAAGEIRPTITGLDTCTVDMGKASLTSKDYPGGALDGRGTLISGSWNGSMAEREWQFRHVSIGNPQCAIHVADMTEMQLFELSKIGPEIEGHALFPNRTNVSMYTEIEPHCIRARIYERGVGETLSSGTGATGAAVAYVLERTADQASRTGSERVTVVLDGGELEVEVGEDLHVNLTGWAKPVFEGRLSDEFVRELKEIDEIE